MVERRKKNNFKKQGKSKKWEDIYWFLEARWDDYSFSMQVMYVKNQKKVKTNKYITIKLTGKKMNKSKILVTLSRKRDF